MKLFLIVLLIALPTLAHAQTCIQADINHPDSVALVWADNSNDESGFVLERKQDAGTFQVIAAALNADLTSYTDSAIKRASVPVTFTYRVKAVRASDKTESAYSNESCITFAALLPPPPLPLKPPSGLTLSSVTRNSMRLSWTDNSTDEKGFAVTRIKDSTLQKIILGATNASSIVDTGLQANTTYRYQVSAFNDAGFSVPSTQVSARTLR